LLEVSQEIVAQDEKLQEMQDQVLDSLLDEVSEITDSPVTQDVDDLSDLLESSSEGAVPVGSRFILSGSVVKT
jgi:hypothetical protein